MEQITKDFVNDWEMVELAKNNSPEDFKKIYEKEFPKKTFKRYQENNEMFLFFITHLALKVPLVALSSNHAFRSPANHHVILSLHPK